MLDKCNVVIIIGSSNKVVFVQDNHLKSINSLMAMPTDCSVTINCIGEHYKQPIASCF